jgi:hypothetical protein
MNTQQAYINGFVKRASEYGLTQNEAIELLKSAGPRLAPGVQDPEGFLSAKLPQFPSKALAVDRTPSIVSSPLRHVPGTADFDNNLIQKLQHYGKQTFPDQITLR